MNKLFLSFLLIGSLTMGVRAQSDSLIGFWEAELVTVGDQSMTPVSKWFRINPDGSYQSGNGWQQSSSGSWNYESGIFTPSDSLGLENKYGGFKLSFENHKMIWQREEEGMQVTVNLKKIESLPMAPWDYLVGVWELEEITQDEKSIHSEFDPEGKHQIFFRWNKMYVQYTPSDKFYGYWHFHSHQPLLTMIPRSNPEAMEKWKIQVDSDQLILEGLTEDLKGIKRVYRRGRSLAN